MKKMIFGLMMVLLLCGAQSYAADGDLLVNGNLGVGTTSPEDKLQVNDGNIKFGTDGKGIVFPSLKLIGSGQTIQFQTNAGYPFMMVDPANLSMSDPGSDSVFVRFGNSAMAGYVGLGGVSAWDPALFNRLYLYNSDNGYGLSLATMAGDIRFYNRGFYDAEENVYYLTEQMRIDSDGHVGIGTTNPTYQLQLSSDSAAKPGTSVWSIPSDSRLKKNIQPYKKGLKEILQINPVSYQYNGKGGIGHKKSCVKKDPAKPQKCVEQDISDTELLSKTQVGVIAQDIQSVVPESVTSHKGKINEDDTEETDILDFNSHALTFILINAVKDLEAQIESLNQQIADLKGTTK